MQSNEANPFLACAAGLLPIFTVHLCLAISLAQETVPWCNPYLDGCTSISATGRNGYAWYVFKAGMLPSAALIAAFFMSCATWVARAGAAGSKSLVWLVRVGVGAGAALALYTVFLGVDGEILRLLRRSGAVLFFGLSALAQILLLNAIWQPGVGSLQRLPPWLRPALLALASFLLLIGLGSIAVKQFVADPDAIENAIEWQFAMAMSLFYILIGLAMHIHKRSAVADPRDHSA
jgi:hypothetical protein